MTSIAQALRDGARALESSSDTARLDAELLMAHALGVTRSDMLIRHQRDPAPAGFAPLLERRKRHEPVAYIIGRQEFYGRDFTVSPDVLIPRGDSETLVNAALDRCPAPARVLDLGTGSGALLLTVLAERRAAKGLGIDRSPAALDIARANAAALGLDARASFRSLDWTRPGWASGLGQFDLILANPPYIDQAEELEPSVRLYEPEGALFAGREGLDDYRLILPQLPQLLAPGGIVTVEIGSTQADAVTALAGEEGLSCELQCDLAGRPRVLVMEIRLGNAVNQE